MKEKLDVLTRFWNSRWGESIGYRFRCVFNNFVCQNKLDNLPTSM